MTSHTCPHRLNFEAPRMLSYHATWMTPTTNRSFRSGVGAWSSASLRPLPPDCRRRASDAPREAR